MAYKCNLCGEEALTTAHVCKQAINYSSGAAEVETLKGTVPRERRNVMYWETKTAQQIDRAEKAEAQNKELRGGIIEMKCRELRSGGMKIEQARIHAEVWAQQALKGES